MLTLLKKREEVFYAASSPGYFAEDGGSSILRMSLTLNPFVFQAWYRLPLEGKP